ncbi:MAG: 30S ribosomal protein S3 [Candidatus Heimdallarchaeota archaeon]|nr:30S ribosomal protein S3 [Candidatus Heimdallarchaeota archaeon]
MPNSIKNFTERRLNTTFLDEYFKDKLASAEYGYMIFQPSSTVTKITLRVGRVGLAIGRRGKTIKQLSIDAKKILGNENVQIEVEALEEPEIYPQVMAQRLASSLERGRHFRRSAYGTMRRIMSSGALGCEITVSGKITSQRARVENFREGFVAKTGDPATKFVKRGYASAKIKRGTLGVTILIMVADAILPDAVEIIAEPTHTSREIIREEQLLDDDLDETIDEKSLGDLPEDFDDLEELEATVDEDLPEEATSALEEDDLEELEEAKKDPKEEPELEALE